MWAGFAALGNKTFYVAGLSPMVDVFAMTSMVVLLARWGRGQLEEEGAAGRAL